MTVSTAIILAAGMGTRLRGLHAGRPKGFVAIGGTTLIARSTRCLRGAGLTRIVLVAGYEADTYRTFAAGARDVEVVLNEAFAETGSMASLNRALDVVDEDFLLLESDLLYERRAVELLAAETRADVVLASGPTGATDSVWIDAPGGLLRGMSKDRAALAAVNGELVGITRLSRATAEVMRTVYGDAVASGGGRGMSYETDALVAAAATRAVAVHVVPDLVWGEVDDERHYARLCDEVWPAIRHREATP